jgi:hypothetical protein
MRNLGYLNEAVHLNCWIHHRDYVRTVIVGRVFAKQAYETGGAEDEMAGFGHFGMASLLVIQQIEKVW